MNECDHGVHVFALDYVHECVKLISCEVQIPTYCD